MSRSSRRSSSRTREAFSNRGRDSSPDRNDRKRRDRSRSRSPPARGGRQHDRANGRVEGSSGSFSKSEIQDMIDRKVAEDIKIAAERRVSEYVESEDFLLMVESFKRREREKVMLEIQRELEHERQLLLSEGRKCSTNSVSVQAGVAVLADSGSLSSCDREESDLLSPAARADAILLQNKLKMEEEQRRIYNEKQKEEAERLAEILRRKQLEVNLSDCDVPAYRVNNPPILLHMNRT